MNALLLLAVQNTLLALVLAFVVYGVTRVRRIPPLAHLLWLLVLLKLVAPPVLPIDSSRLLPPRTKQVDQQIADTSRNVPQTARHQQQPLIAEPGAIAPHQRSRGSVKVPSDRTAHEPVESALEGKLTGRLAWISDRAVWDGALIFIFWCWLSGAVFFSLVAGTRILRFEQTLKHTMPAPERLQRLARDIAGKLNVRRIPNIRFVESVEVPMLWWAGRRATIVLPTKLFQQLDDSEAALILAHELAHLRRRDHWVRAIEMLVSIVYWWNPLVWAIRRQIHRAEDLCCDAWVRWAFPDCTKRYAEVVLKAAELLNSPGVAPRLLPASPFLGSDSLKARIEMILQSRFAPGLSKRSLFVVALLALVTLPTFFSAARTEAQEPPARDYPFWFFITAAKDQAAAPASKLDRPAGSEFSFAVKFEQGATRFLKGDKITITEVRGTADSFTQGNIFWIKGTYTLGSCDKAILLASATIDSSEAMNWAHDWSARSDLVFRRATGALPGQASGFELHVQRAEIRRGRGTFTLFLPMNHRGWPHVSFCSPKNGKAFGASYFTTPDSVARLAEWWTSDVGDEGDEATLRQIEAKLARLGGTIDGAGGVNGPVTGIDFAGSHLINDEHLALLGAFKSLTTVGLGHTGITDAGLEKLGKLTQLNTLYIDNTLVTDAGLKELKPLQHLLSLGMGHTRTTDAGLMSVREITYLSTLYLDNTQITDAGLKELKTLKYLTTLGLGHTATGDASLKTIRDCWNLTTLYIDNTQITDRGLQNLEALKDLTTLGLGHTRISDEGLKHLADLTKLQTLYLDHTLVTDAGVSALKKSLPNVHVVR